MWVKDVSEWVCGVLQKKVVVGRWDSIPGIWQSSGENGGERVKKGRENKCNR